MFVDKGKPNHVWQLHKTLYGLKQSPRAKFDKYSTYLLEFGFICSKSNPFLFVYLKNQDVIMLLLYVDDIVITRSNPKLISTLLSQMSDNFSVKDMGQLHYFLGIQAQFHEEGMFLSQQQYAEDLLRLASMLIMLQCQHHCHCSVTEYPIRKNYSQIQLISEA